MPETDRIGAAHRILVYGVTGSGKSTLASTLSEIIGIPATSVDDITWSPGWVPMPTDEQIAHFDSLTRTDSWLLDSAYDTWRFLVLDRVDLIVALDYPRWLSLGRLLRRTAVGLIARREICNGNRETLRTTFARDSIIAWHFKSFSRKRAEMRRLAGSASAPLVVLLGRPRDAERFLGRVREEVAGTGRVTP